MTQFDLLASIVKYKETNDWDALITIVEAYAEGIIAKSFSPEMKEFYDNVEHMQGLYSKQRYTQAEEWRDKLAKQLDDIMRLGKQ